jgi:hypothetical protein
VASYAVDADEDVFAYFWGGRRSGFILIFLALSFSLFALGWLDVRAPVIS